MFPYSGSDEQRPTLKGFRKLSTMLLQIFQEQIVEKDHSVADVISPC